MKKNDKQSVESGSSSQLSIATIKVKEDSSHQDNIINELICSSPAFLSLNNSALPSLFSGDSMSDSSREYEDKISLTSNEIDILRDYFSKSPSPSPSPILP